MKKATIGHTGPKKGRIDAGGLDKKMIKRSKISTPKKGSGAGIHSQVKFCVEKDDYALFDSSIPSSSSISPSCFSLS